MTLCFGTFVLGSADAVNSNGMEKGKVKTRTLKPQGCGTQNRLSAQPLRHPPVMNREAGNRKEREKNGSEDPPLRVDSGRFFFYGTHFIASFCRGSWSEAQYSLFLFVPRLSELDPHDQFTCQDKEL